MPGRSHRGAGWRERGGRPSRLLTKQGSPDGMITRKPQRVRSKVFPSGGFGPAARPAPASPRRLPARGGCLRLLCPPGRILLPTQPGSRNGPTEVLEVMAGLGSLRSGWQRACPKGERRQCPAPGMWPSLLWFHGGGLGPVRGAFAPPAGHSARSWGVNGAGCAHGVFGIHWRHRGGSSRGGF